MSQTIYILLALESNGKVSPEELGAHAANRLGSYDGIDQRHGDRVRVLDYREALNKAYAEGRKECLDAWKKAELAAAGSLWQRLKNAAFPSYQKHEWER